VTARDAIALRRATPADASAIARVYVRSWRTTYRGLIPRGVLAGLDELRQTGYWWAALCETRPGYDAVVAESPATGVVGFSAFGPARDDGPAGRGEIYTLYLLAPHQGRGIGRLLLGWSATRLRDGGFTSMCVWVLADNPARRFYERLGGVELASREIGVGGIRLAEVCYLWPRLGRETAPAGGAGAGDGGAGNGG
jgi:GNAT superfamily N-acetyltransferase